MADFCQQCSIRVLGEDFGDLRDLGNGQTLESGNGWAVLCEGCGPTLVDDDGRCVSPDCPTHGTQVVEILV